MTKRERILELLLKIVDVVDAVDVTPAMHNEIEQALRIAIEERDKTIRELEASNWRIKEAHVATIAERDDLRRQITEGRHNDPLVTELRKRLTGLSDDLTNARRERDDAAASRDRLDRLHAIAVESNRELCEKLNQTRKELADRNADVEHVLTSLAGKDRELESTRANRNAWHVEATSLRAERDRLRKDLAAAITSYDRDKMRRERDDAIVMRDRATEEACRRVQKARAALNGE